MDAQQIIDKCLSILEKDQSNNGLLTGFKFFALRVDGSTICLYAANAFIADFLQRDYLSKFVEVISKVVEQKAVDVTRVSDWEFRIRYEHDV